MGETVLQNLMIMFNFIIATFALSLFLFFIIRFLTRKTKKGKERERILLYGIFQDMNARLIVAFSSSFVKFLLIIWLIVLNKNLSYFHLTLIIILGISHSIFSSNYIRGIVDIVHSIIVYFSLFFNKLIIDYTVEYGGNKLLTALSVLIGIFIFSYAVYLFFKSISEIIEKNLKFVNDKRREEKV